MNLMNRQFNFIVFLTQNFYTTERIYIRTLLLSIYYFNKQT